jgi:hypothetical protein
MSEEERQTRTNQNLLKTEGTGWDIGYGNETPSLSLSLCFSFLFIIFLIEFTTRTAILYLASREAKWVTGVILPVDAGATAGNPNRLQMSQA